MTLYRVWFGCDPVYWTSVDEYMARVQVQLWAWMATGRYQHATRVEEIK